MSTDKEMELTKEIEKLREKNKKLRECVAFYASTSNWKSVTRLDFSDTFRIDDCEFLKEGYCLCGGKFARQTLREIGG